MNTKDTVIFIIIAAAVAVITTFVATQQVDRDTFIIFSFLAVPILISYYFNSRKSKIPSSSEKIVASVWLLIRRLVCFSAAIFLGGLAILIVIFSDFTFQSFGASFAFIVVSAFCIWVGFYGQGWKRADWKDDVALHNQNKARYKWPW